MLAQTPPTSLIDVVINSGFLGLFYAFFTFSSWSYLLWWTLLHLQSLRNFKGEKDVKDKALVILSPPLSTLNLQLECPERICSSVRLPEPLPLHLPMVLGLREHFSWRILFSSFPRNLLKAWKGLIFSPALIQLFYVIYTAQIWFSLPGLRLISSPKWKMNKEKTEQIK